MGRYDAPGKQLDTALNGRTLDYLRAYAKRTAWRERNALDSIGRFSGVRVSVQ